MKIFLNISVMKIGRLHFSIIKRSMKFWELRWASKWLMNFFWPGDRLMGKGSVRWMRDLKRPKKTSRKEFTETLSKGSAKWVNWPMNKKLIRDFSSSFKMFTNNNNIAHWSNHYYSIRGYGQSSAQNILNHPTKDSAGMASKPLWKKGTIMDSNSFKIKT